MADRQDDATATLAGVRLSHPGRVLYERQGVTKLDLARYLDSVAEPFLAHTANRLVSLVRCPRGQGEQCFFQRHGGTGLPEAFRRLGVRAKDGSEDEYLYLTDRKGLISAAQMGVLEFHIWGSRVDDIERPDRLVFDLDPDEGLDFGAVKLAAERVRDVLGALDLQSFPLLTGGKGIHVVAPLVRRHEWPTVKAFAEAVARRMAEDAPDTYVATMSKAKRRGKIFIDYFRNERSASAIAPFSPRAREGAPLAWPVSWDALEKVKAPDQYRLLDADPSDTDGWAGYEDVRQSLKKACLRALGVAD